MLGARRLRHVRFVGISAAIALSMVAACDDDGGGSNVGIPPIGYNPSEGGASEAAPDAGSDAPTASPIRVTVTVLAGVSTTPVEGAPVVSHDLAGTLTSAVVRTGADGKVTVDATDGGIVTVGTGGAGKGERRVFTYVGVKDGDTLHVREQVVYPAIQVSVPEAGFPAGPNPRGWWSTAGGCRTNPPIGGAGISAPPPATVSVTATSDCRGTGNYPLAAITGALIVDGYPQDGTFLPSIAPDAATATLGAWQSVPASVQFEAPNAPPSPGGEAVFRAATLTSLVGGAFSSPLGCSPAGPTSQSCRTFVDIEDGYQARLRTGFVDSTQQPPLILHANVLKRVPKSPLVRIDEPSPDAPLVATSSFALDRSNPARPVFSWRTPIEGAAGAIGELGWSSKAGAYKPLAKWIFVLPASGSLAPIAAPALPPELAEGLAPADSTFTASIEVLQSELLPDYDTLRKNAADWHRPDAELVLPALGSARTMRATVNF